MTTPATINALTVNIKCCARCGENHNALEFSKLKEPIQSWTYWALCPLTREPIMMEVKPQ